MQFEWSKFLVFFVVGVFLDLAGRTYGFLIGSTTDNVNVGLTTAILMIGSKYGLSLGSHSIWVKKVMNFI